MSQARRAKLKPICTRENRLCWVEFIAGIICLMLGHIIVFIGVSIDYGAAAAAAAAVSSPTVAATTVGTHVTAATPALRNATATTAKTTAKTTATTPRFSSTTSTPGVTATTVAATASEFDPWASMSPGVQGLTYFGLVLLVAGVALLVVSGVHYRRMKARAAAATDSEDAETPPLQQPPPKGALRTTSRSLESVLTHQSYVPATPSGAFSGESSRNNSERVRSSQDPLGAQQPPLPNVRRPESARQPQTAPTPPQQPLSASRESALERLGNWIATSTRRAGSRPNTPADRASSRSINRSAASSRAGSVDALSRNSGGRSRSSSVSQPQPQPLRAAQQNPPIPNPSQATNQLGHQSRDPYRQGSGRQAQQQQQRQQHQRQQLQRAQSPARGRGQRPATQQRSQSNPRVSRA